MLFVTPVPSPLKEYGGTEKVKGTVARMVKSRTQLLYDTLYCKMND